MSEKIPQNDDKIKLATEQIIKNLKLKNDNTISLADSPTSGMQMELGEEAIEGLDDEVEKILALLQMRGIDAVELQALLIALINQYISSKKLKQSPKAQKEIQKLIAKEVAIASKLIIQQYNLYLNKTTGEAEQSSNLFVPQDGLAKQQLRYLIKTFAIYEIYKSMTPRRIAGETKLDNFIHNVLSHRDVKYATRFAGGKKRDIDSYSASVKNTLKKENIRNKDLLGR